MDPNLLLISRVEQFLFQEARLLDERHFEEWLALFSDDGVYWIPARINQEDPVEEVSIAYEDRQLLEVRVRRLRHPDNYSDQPAARTQRIIGNVTIVSTTDDITLVRSNFTLVEFQNDEQQVFAGEYLHTLREGSQDLKIVQKRVNLLNCDAPMGAIVIPF
ncbi:MAG: aromatic-ring-hydroxylating dioxygenase subunit beta [Pseudomonadota bacterium]|nr:aromatic-ring-hydroxylating dioxygenase subunit beta [Pseudomonadota bacterium]